MPKCKTRSNRLENGMLSTLVQGKGQPIKVCENMILGQFYVVGQTCVKVLI